MFKKNTSNPDIKKSQLKSIDLKKDIPTRLKHLKSVLGKLKCLFDNFYGIQVTCGCYLCFRSNTVNQNKYIFYINSYIRIL